MTDKPPRARTKWTPEQKAEAVAIADEHGLWTAHERTRIPYATIRGWRLQRERTTRRNRPGRPSELTDQVQSRLVEALGAGNSVQGACEYAGINTTTYQAWCRRTDDELARRDAITGDDPLPDVREREERYVTLVLAAREARASAKQSCVELIRRVAQGGAVSKERTITHPNGRVEVIREHYRSEWTAAAWLLERSHPDEFGRRQRVEHSGRVDSDVRVDTAEERRSAVAAMRDDLAARRAAAAEGAAATG